MALPVLPWQHTRSGVCLKRYSEGFFHSQEVGNKERKKKQSERRRNGEGEGERRERKKKSDNSRSISELNHLPKLLGTRVSKFTGRAVSSGVCMSHGTAPAAGTAPQPGSQSPRCHLCPSACPSPRTPPLCAAVHGPCPRPGSPSTCGLPRQPLGSAPRGPELIFP